MKLIGRIVLMAGMAASSSAFAQEILLTAAAPAGTQIVMTVGYRSTSDSWSCTEFVMEDFKRVPKVFDEKYEAKSADGRLVVSAPTMIKKCKAEQISSPSIEITLAGTNSTSSLDYKGSDISVVQVATDIAGQQVVECQKFQSAKGLTTLCSNYSVKMGPSQTADILVVEK